MKIDVTALEDALEEFESKKLRYVRTPAGEERYDKPIGSPILPKLVVGLGVIAAAAGVIAAPSFLGGGDGPNAAAVPSVSSTPNVPSASGPAIPGLDTLPKRPTPTSVQGFRSMWDSQISPEHWGGADVSLSVPMKDGRSVWLYGDTLSYKWGMQHSTAIVQDGGNVRVANEGKQLLPNGTNTADGRKVLYWIEAAKEVAPNTLEVTAQETSVGTKNVWDFKRNKTNSRVATVTVDEAGDMKFQGWKGWTKGPKLDYSLYPIPGKGAGYFAYSKQAHPQFKLDSGNVLHTYARNRDNLKPGEMLPFEDYKPMFVDGPALEQGSFKSLLDTFGGVLETKSVVRHVRTPAGVKRYKQPIGSVIVRDSVLRNIKEIDSDFEGWSKYDGGGKQFYVGKDAGDWVVADPDDNVLSAHSNEADALKWLDSNVKPVRKSTKPVGTGKFTPKPGAFNDPRVEELQELSKLPKSMVNNKVRRRMEELSEQIKKDVGAPSVTQASNTPTQVATPQKTTPEAAGSELTQRLINGRGPEPTDAEVAEMVAYMEADRMNAQKMMTALSVGKASRRNSNKYKRSRVLYDKARSVKLRLDQEHSAREREERELKRANDYIANENARRDQMLSLLDKNFSDMTPQELDLLAAIEGPRASSYFKEANHPLAPKILDKVLAAQKVRDRWSEKVKASMGGTKADREKTMAVIPHLGARDLEQFMAATNYNFGNTKTEMEHHRQLREKLAKRHKELSGLNTGNGLSVGGRARTEWGDGTVSQMSGRAVVVKLDNGETINIVTGTPGHRRLLDMNKATTKEVDWSKPGVEIARDFAKKSTDDILAAVSGVNNKKTSYALRALIDRGDGERLTDQQLVDVWEVNRYSDGWTTELLDRAVLYLKSKNPDPFSADMSAMIAMNHRAADIHNRSNTKSVFEDLATSLESAMSQFAAGVIEHKSVRHVRTPAGVRRFKQPIGSVIVAKGRDNKVTKVFKNIKALDDHGENWNKYEGTDGKVYHSVQIGDGDGQKWYATDVDDNVLLEDTTAEQLLDKLDAHIAKNAGKSASTTPRTVKTNNGGAIKVSQSPNKPRTTRASTSRAKTTTTAKPATTRKTAAKKPTAAPTTRKTAAKKATTTRKPAATTATPTGPRKAKTSDGYPLFYAGDEKDPSKITLPKNLSRDKNARLGALTKVDSDADGWDKYEDGDLTRYIGKGDDGRWELRDENDNIYAVVEGGSKANATKLLRFSHLSYDDPSSPVRQQPYRVDRGKYAIRASEKNKATVANNKLRHVESEAELSQFLLTHGPVMDNGSVPRKHANILITDDPSDPQITTMGMFIQRDGDKDGQWQYRYRKVFRDNNDAKKWERNTRFDKDVPLIDAEIDKADLSTNDDMMVVALMRKYGARVGSDKRSGKDADEPRGITELSLKDVQIEGNTVVIDYPGKKYNAATGAGWQHYEIDDPQLVAAFKKRISKLKGDDDLFFPKSTASSTIKIGRSITGGEYTNHDYRRLFATQQAAAMVRAKRPQPKTQEEVNAAIKQIGADVDVLLNDKNQALTSYINPAVFDKWKKK